MLSALLGSPKVFQRASWSRVGSEWATAELLALLFFWCGRLAEQFLLVVDFHHDVVWLWLALLSKPVLSKTPPLPSGEHSREHSGEHSGEHSREHSKEHSGEHSGKHSRTKTRKTIAYYLKSPSGTKTSKTIAYYLRLRPGEAKTRTRARGNPGEPPAHPDFQELACETPTDEKRTPSANCRRGHEAVERVRVFI